MNANAAWLTCAVIAHNLARAAGVLADGKLAKARTTTIRATLINIPARVCTTARTYTLHLPANSRREQPFMAMFDAIQAPPQRPDPPIPAPTQARTARRTASPFT